MQVCVSVCVCVRIVTVLFTLCAGMQVLQQEGSRGRDSAGKDSAHVG